MALNDTSAERLRTLCLERDKIGLRANYPWDLCKMARSIAEYEGREPALDEYLLPRAAKLYWGATDAPMSAAALTSSTTGPKAAAPSPSPIESPSEEMLMAMVTAE